MIMFTDGCVFLCILKLGHYKLNAMSVVIALLDMF